MTPDGLDVAHDIPQREQITDTIVNALSYRLGVGFEITASTLAYILISDADSETDAVNDIDDLANAYNRMGKEGRMIDAIGQTFSRWFVRPTQEKYSRLVEFYKLLANHVEQRNGE